MIGEKLTSQFMELMEGKRSGLLRVCPRPWHYPVMIGCVCSSKPKNALRSTLPLLDKVQSIAKDSSRHVHTLAPTFCEDQNIKDIFDHIILGVLYRSASHRPRTRKPNLAIARLFLVGNKMVTSIAASTTSRETVKTIQVTLNLVRVL